MNGSFRMLGKVEIDALRCRFPRIRADIADSLAGKVNKVCRVTVRIRRRVTAFSKARRDGRGRLPMTPSRRKTTHRAIGRIIALVANLPDCNRSRSMKMALNQ
jgi:hypothetical protein